MALDWNAWAKERNREPGRHANYYLTEKMPGGGTKSVEDPYYSSPEWMSRPESGFGKADNPTLQWRANRPGSVLYNPGGGSNWSALSGETLSDPSIIGMLRKGAGSGGPQAGAYSGLLAKVPASVMQGIEGSKHSLDPSILGKMWR